MRYQGGAPLLYKHVRRPSRRGTTLSPPHMVSEPFSSTLSRSNPHQCYHGVLLRCFPAWSQRPGYREAIPHQLHPLAHASHAAAQRRGRLRLCRRRYTGAGQDPLHQGQGREGIHRAKSSPSHLGVRGSAGAWILAEQPHQGGACAGDRDHHVARALGGTVRHVLLAVSQPRQQHQNLPGERPEGQQDRHHLLRRDAWPRRRTRRRREAAPG
uniref:Uncharacterized protein n=1 Tax=Triticum urartu TaxID=4572 RepID=A0A8R7P3R4_TRIUA